MKDRIELAIIGAIAGIALWALFELLPERVEAPFTVFFVLTVAAVFFAVLMALVGPERPQRALLPSGVLGLGSGLLALWAAHRFATPEAFWGVLSGPVAVFTLVAVATPFAAAGLDEKGGWRSYEKLFDSAWAVCIRYVAGGLFTGLILLALVWSDELLGLVGIAFIGDMLEVDAVRYTLVGGVFGLGVATVYELRGHVSPVLVHRLLRMLLPLLLGVVVVFIGALPFRGLNELFGQLSTAAVLMSVAFAAITLVTTALDRDEQSASRLGLMRVSVRVMSLLLPVLVGLAIYAIWLRVAAYGWTPDRVAAAYIAAFLAAYATVYALAALRGRDWQPGLRRGNLYMALAVCAGAALWLTPVMDAQRISAQSQLARFEAGTGEGALALYELAQEWGHSGEAALEQIAAGADETLAARIALARAAQTEAEYRRKSRDEGLSVRRDQLAQKMIIRPEDADLDGLLGRLRAHALSVLERACPEADTPGCVIILTEPSAGLYGLEFGYVVTRDRQFALVERSGELRAVSARALGDKGDFTALPQDAFERIVAGEYRIETVTRTGLRIGDAVILPYN